MPSKDYNDSINPIDSEEDHEMRLTPLRLKLFMVITDQFYFGATQPLQITCSQSYRVYISCNH